MLELDLAEVARSRMALAEAEERYSRALRDLDVVDGRRLRALRGRGNVRYHAGKVAEAIADLEAACRLAAALGDVETEIEARLELATAQDWNNDAPAAEESATRAAGLFERAGLTSHHLQAGLFAAEGRALFRRGRWIEAVERLERAVRSAECLGDAGYETLIVGLLLLEVVYPMLGRAEEAEAVAARAIALTEARGDRINLASALNNRRNLLVAKGALGQAIADQSRFIEIGRELGLTLAEYFGEYNIGELLYQSGDIEGATPHVARAESFEVAKEPVAQRPVAALLRARVLAFCGLVEEARGVLGEIQATVRRAEADGHAIARLSPSEEVLVGMIDLVTRDSSDEEWDALVERSSRDSVEQEPLEVLEMRAIAELRRGRIDAARRTFERALALAPRVPSVIESRIRKTLAAHALAC